MTCHSYLKTDRQYLQSSFEPDSDSTVLHCTVLYCTALHCNVLYCTVLYCTMASTGYDASHAMYSPREITGRVTFLSFGPHRNLTFPHCYFCSECKAYEQDKHSNPFGRGSRLGKMYNRKVNHTGVDNPSEVGGLQLSYYASTQVEMSQVAAVS
jgi:hypothetical protein